MSVVHLLDRIVSRPADSARPDGAALLRILVVGDEQITTILNEIFWHERLTIDVACDDIVGATLATMTTYSLILIDLPTPHVDGQQLCQRLRGRGVTAPIVIVNAYGTADDIVAGIEAGADHYIVGSIHVDELRARLTALLRRSGYISTAPAILHVRNLLLDLRHQEIRRDGQRIELSKEEYEVLAYLMRHSGRTVTRAELAQHVWGKGVSIHPALVDRVIKNLSDLLNREHGRPLISSVDAGGYTIKY